MKFKKAYHKEAIQKRIDRGVDLQNIADVYGYTLKEIESLVNPPKKKAVKKAARKK